MDLAEAHLAAQHAPGRFAFHDLLRAYAAERVGIEEDDAERSAATGRMLDHYLHTAHAAYRIVAPTRDPLSLASPQVSVAPYIG